VTTYALVMIVKDASGDLPRTLAAARKFISHWTICDTGSTDDTVKIIRRELKGIPGKLYRDKWVNFGHNRSLAFARAHKTADWLLLLDADMAVDVKEGFEPDPAFDACMIEMGNHTSFSYRLPLVVRGDVGWKSVGRVHEYTSRMDGTIYNAVATDGVTVDMLAIDRSSPEKFAMHARFLEESLAEDPTNSRDTYYLAQTYNCLGDPRAREFFLKRVTMGGYDQEVWYSKFRAACLAEDWEDMQRELIEAWEMRAHRMEALCALARGYNQRDKHQMAYALTSVIPPMNPDVLFVHTDVWDWGLKMERSIAAWWVGKKAEARVLCDELLANPRLPAHIRAQVEKNREFM
jgi:hypothetical protein